MPGEKLTPKAALPKIRQFCAYQERCHQEVKEKLFGYGLNTIEADEIISQLIQDNYLNEERFAVQFAGGKFRIKHWGRNRIRQELKQRQVSEFCIRRGLQEIPDDEYQRTLQKLFDMQAGKHRGEKNQFTKKRKIADFLRYKGFESDLIYALLNKKES